jgi:hypothetical protein
MDSQRYRVGFDIGGVISKYPVQMQALMRALSQSREFEVFVVTDMPRDIALTMLAQNSVVIPEDHVLCADWTKHQDLCKSMLMKEYSIEIMIDDRPDYITEGVPIGLAVMPRPHHPYYHPSWVQKS